MAVGGRWFAVQPAKMATSHGRMISNLHQPLEDRGLEDHSRSGATPTLRARVSISDSRWKWAGHVSHGLHHSFLTTASRAALVAAMRSPWNLISLLDQLALDLFPEHSCVNLIPFRIQDGFPSTRAKRSRSGATKPVHPVWWLAPIPAPLSPWKTRRTGSGHASADRLGISSRLRRRADARSRLAETCS